MDTLVTRIASLPQEPGVYLFKNEKGEIIYVGKAKRLRNRVSSYFKGKDHSPKTRVLITHIKEIDFILVDNEVEALLLENRLIKKHWPRFNISLKDAKTYAYILVTDEKFPRILSVRSTKKKGTYFGPYVDGFMRHELVQLAIKLFQIRVCEKLPKRECLNYHIGTCTAPCILNADEVQYRKQVEGAISFLKGDTKEVLDRLESEMKTSSKNLKFEIALEKRRQIDAIHTLKERQNVDRVRSFDQDVIAFVRSSSLARVALLPIKKVVVVGKKEFKFEYDEEVFQDFLTTYYSQNPIPNEIVLNVACWKDDAEKESLEGYLSKLRGSSVTLTLPKQGDKLALSKLAEKNLLGGSESTALLDIQQKLNLPQLPSVIECFDISNLGTEHVVAGMVQFKDGDPNKGEYRRFEMKSVIGQDDFASMKEVVHRRYKRLNEENKSLPHLIIIDGGSGQLSSALSSLQELGLQLPIISLAKENEEIYLPNEPSPRTFEKNSKMMLLIRRIRDEVHRFVLGYNKKKRQMRFREEASFTKKIIK